MRTTTTFLLIASLAGCCFGGAPRQRRSAPEPVPPPRAAAPIEAPDAGSPPLPEPLEERVLGDLAPLIEPCLRVMSRDAARARDDYFGRVDRDAGPDPRRGAWVREVYPRQIERCRAAVEAVASTPPAMNEIDAAAARLVRAAATLFPIVNEAHAYYRRQDHRDDDFARGRELHPQLVRAFDEHDAAHQALAALVDAAQRRARESRLARFEGDPARRGPYLVELVVSQAIELLEVVDTIEVAEHRFTTPLREELAERSARFRATVDELRAGQDAWFARDRAHRDLVRVAARLADRAMSLMRQVRDDVVISQWEISGIQRGSCGPAPGTPGCVRESYRELLVAYERL